MRAEQVQRRRMALFICLLALIVLVVVLALTCGGGEETASTTTSEATATTLVSAAYTAELTGTSRSPGQDDGDRDPHPGVRRRAEVMSYVLTVTRALTNPSVATINAGEPGSDEGAAVYTLFAGPMKKGPSQASSPRAPSSSRT